MNLSEKIQTNTWDHIRDFLKVLRRVSKPWSTPSQPGNGWTWSRNTRCKYVDLRVDMRDGGCIIKDRHGNRISPEQLAWQYSEQTPNPPDGASTAEIPMRQQPFPMQGGPCIPWDLAEEIYKAYSALHGKQQTLERLAERGGFDWAEIPVFGRHYKHRFGQAMPGWSLS